MNAWGQDLVRCVVVAAVGFLGVSALAGVLGLRWNGSPSLPRGIYREGAVALARGWIVLVCPPREFATLFRSRGYLGRGDCPGDVEPIGKPVAAVAGELVEVRADGVWIDGVIVPRSRPWLRDVLGRSLPSQIGRRFVLAPDQISLLSTHHPRSLDGRIFGPIAIDEVRAGLIPLLVERKKGRAL